LGSRYKWDRDRVVIHPFSADVTDLLAGQDGERYEDFTNISTNLLLESDRHIQLFSTNPTFLNQKFAERITCHDCTRLLVVGRSL
tara:strand:- start:4430 stop:4684 length:255 start_codon:yes stop_codon:yes gene_type:complete